MTELERRKLRLLRDAFGGHMTPDEALRLALEAEQIKRDCGPHDPAYQRFAYEQQALENMALLLEKEAAGKEPA